MTNEEAAAFFAAQPANEEAKVVLVFQSGGEAVEERLLTGPLDGIRDVEDHWTDQPQLWCPER